MRRISKPNRSILAALGFLWALAVLAWPARGWIRVSYEDAEVVQRSELTVVGGIDSASIQFVAHANVPGTGASWEHHATLRVKRVLKGKCADKEIAIIIHYGLEPLVDGHAKHWDAEINLRPPAGAPPGSVQIADAANDVAIDAAVPDARADNIWFLRRRGGDGGEKPGNGNYGIVDPQDLQSLALERYFACYLAADPETAIRKQLAEQPAVARRATRYLERQHMLRLINTPDPAERVERLLPYYCNRGEWALAMDARHAIRS